MRPPSINEEDTHQTLSAAPVRRRRLSVGSAIEVHANTENAASLASIDRPPSKEDSVPITKVYSPHAPAVIALLMPASMFGVLARLGLQALTKYNGASIFPLAYVQATGCLFMGIALRLKEPIGNLYALPPMPNIALAVNLFDAVTAHFTPR
jgi:CrcB protein